jgi:dTDP-glucose 4,6-dehydratase
MNVTENAIYYNCNERETRVARLEEYFYAKASISSATEPVYKNILITGGAGFIGANFVHYMLRKYVDYSVIIYDSLTYAGNTHSLSGLAEQYGERYTFVQGDICDDAQVAQTMARYEIDCVVNFAAETHVDRSLMQPSDFARTNVLGTCTLLEQARSMGVKRYHQVSTDEVYGQILVGSFKETDNLDPRSPYSASKAGGDAMCLAYFNSFGLPVTISRCSNNIGPFQHPEKVVPLFVTNLLEDLPLPVYGDGQYERDYLYVYDHCAGVDTVLHEGEPGQIYNIGSGVETKNLHLAFLLCDMLRKPYSLIQLVDDRPGQDRRYSLDCTKIELLGWKPRYTLEEALQRTVDWYVQNEWWWRQIKTGTFRHYYEQQYGERLVRASGDQLLHLV